MTQTLFTIAVYMFLGLYITNTLNPKSHNEKLSTKDRFIDIARWPMMYKKFTWLEWVIIGSCLIGLALSYQV